MGFRTDYLVSTAVSLVCSKKTAMAFGQQADMTDLSAATPSDSPGPSSGAADLARHLGQVSLDSSPVLTPKPAKFTRKFSLRELEIQQTIGKPFSVLSLARATVMYLKLIWSVGLLICL